MLTLRLKNVRRVEDLQQIMKMTSAIDKKSLHRLSLNLDLQNLQQADQYETVLSQVSNEEFLSTIDFEAIEELDSATVEATFSVTIQMSMFSLIQSASITSSRDD